MPHACSSKIEGNILNTCNEFRNQYSDKSLKTNMSNNEITSLPALGVPSRVTGNLCQSISPSFNRVTTKFLLMFSESLLIASSLMPYIRRVYAIEDWQNLQVAIAAALHDRMKLIQTPSGRSIVWRENSDGKHRILNCID